MPSRYIQVALLMSSLLFSEAPSLKFCTIVIYGMAFTHLKAYVDNNSLCCPIADLQRRSFLSPHRMWILIGYFLGVSFEAENKILPILIVSFLVVQGLPTPLAQTLN